MKKETREKLLLITFTLFLMSWVTSCGVGIWQDNVAINLVGCFSFAGAFVIAVFFCLDD